MDRNTESVGRNTRTVNSSSHDSPPPSYASAILNDQARAISGQQTSLRDVGDHEPIESASNTPMSQPEINASQLTPVSQQPTGITSGPQPINHQPNPSLAMSDLDPMPMRSLSWMPVPSSDVSVNCSPGLEQLSILNQVIIVPSTDPQTVHLPGSQNKYLIKNNIGQIVFNAAEDDSVSRANLIGQETVEMSLFDINDNQILHFSRVFLSDNTGCCSFFKSYKVNAYCPPGNKISSVIQPSSRQLSQNVVDANGIHQFSIVGQYLCCYICDCAVSDGIELQLVSKGEVIGKIFRGEPSVGNPLVNTNISFPKELHANSKAALIGFATTLDVVIMERLRRRHRRGDEN